MVRSKRLFVPVVSVLIAVSLIGIAQAQHIQRNADGSVEVSDTGPSGTLDMSTGEHLSTYSHSRGRAAGTPGRRAKAPASHRAHQVQQPQQPLSKESALTRAASLEKAAADALAAAAALRAAAGQPSRGIKTGGSKAAVKTSGKQINLMPNMSAPKVAPAGQAKAK